MVNNLHALTQDRLKFIVAAIAAITVVSGLSQLIAPGFVLGIIDADSSATSRHFFAIVGMFMAVIGGLTLHAVWTAIGEHPVMLWAALQKFGAFAAVGLGVGRGVFGVLALSIALFDLLSAGLYLWQWRRIRQ